MSPTLNVNPTLFVIPCKCFGGFLVYSIAIIITYSVIVHLIFNQQYFITSSWQEKVGFGPMDELIHHTWQNLFTYSIRSVIHKVTIVTKNYHRTLNIIFSDVFMCFHPSISWSVSENPNVSNPLCWCLYILCYFKYTEGCLYLILATLPNCDNELCGSCFIWVIKVGLSHIY